MMNKVLQDIVKAIEKTCNENDALFDKKLFTKMLINYAGSEKKASKLTPKEVHQVYEQHHAIVLKRTIESLSDKGLIQIGVNENGLAIRATEKGVELYQTKDEEQL